MLRLHALPSRAVLTRVPHRTNEGHKERPQAATGAHATQTAGQQAGQPASQATMQAGRQAQQPAAPTSRLRRDSLSSFSAATLRTFLVYSFSRSCKTADAS